MRIIKTAHHLPTTTTTSSITTSSTSQVESLFLLELVKLVKIALLPLPNSIQQFNRVSGLVSNKNVYISFEAGKERE